MQYELYREIKKMNMYLQAWSTSLVSRGKVYQVQGFLGVIGVEAHYIYSRFVKTSGHARERGRSINHTQGQRKPRNPMLEADRSTTDENSKMQLMIHLATSPCTDHITGFIQHLVIIKHVTII